MDLKIEFDDKAQRTAMLRAAQEYRKDTKKTIKRRKIWVTGNMWNSIQIMQQPIKKGNTLYSIIGSNKGYLKADYPYPIKVHKKKPFFNWTYKANQRKYHRILEDGIKLK